MQQKPYTFVLILMEPHKMQKFYKFSLNLMAHKIQQKFYKFNLIFMRPIKYYKSLINLV